MGEGSSADYMDRWDVMSTVSNTLMAPHPVYTDLDVFARPVFHIGPGLNAANMFGRGWLDGTRVWNISDNNPVNTTVQIRPLHRRDLPSFLAIRFHGYFVEFRTNSGWDAAVTPTVPVHRLKDNRSYIVADNNGQQDFGPGSFVGTPEKLSIFGLMTKIEVVAIDAEQQLAKIRLVHIPADVPQFLPEDRPFRNPGVAWVEIPGNDNAVVILDRKSLRISRRSPLFDILENIVLHKSASEV
jgi:hypothetical protein